MPRDPSPLQQSFWWGEEGLLVIVVLLVALVGDGTAPLLPARNFANAWEEVN